MAATIDFNDTFLKELWTADHDIDTDVIKVALMADGFTFDKTSDTAFNNTSEIASDAFGGYTTGGATIGSIAVAVSAGVVNVSAANVIWSPTGGAMAEAGFGVVYNSSKADQIIMYIDFGALYTTTDGQQLAINFSAGFATSQQA